MIFNNIVCRELYLLTFYCSSPAGQSPTKPQACTALKHSALPSLPFFIPVSVLVLKMQPTPTQHALALSSLETTRCPSVSQIKHDLTLLRSLPFFVLFTSPFLTLWMYNPVLKYGFIYCRDKCKSEPMIPLSSELKPVHAPFHCAFFYYGNYYCHFCCCYYLGFVFCFSLQLSTLNSQDCGETPLLDSLL
jgi:hypothetical protein